MKRKPVAAKRCEMSLNHDPRYATANAEALRRGGNGYRIRDPITGRVMVFQWEVEIEDICRRLAKTLRASPARS
jgi:hypothetical protein